MARFLNKKEEVYDLKLTSYGRYLLSIGKFKPDSYAFLDDNVIYDGTYAGITEAQSDIHVRIKNDTQYIEGLIKFQEAERETNFMGDGTINYFTSDITPTMERPDPDTLRANAIIGDAYLEGDTNLAPAWKAVLLSGMISSSSINDVKNDDLIPQVNVNVTYFKEIIDREFAIQQEFLNENVRDAVNFTKTFSDGKMIRLVPDDLMLYVEEINTTLLTKNFDLEVFEIKLNENSSSAGITDGLIRKSFSKTFGAIKGGYLGSEFQNFNALRGSSRNQSSTTSSIGYYYDVLSSELEQKTSINTGSVDYYFDVVYDYQIDEFYQIGKNTACKAAELFNKHSYYIDLDFDCTEEVQENVYVDIYGNATEPEICD
jgi:hypothetical protein